MKRLIFASVIVLTLLPQSVWGQTTRVRRSQTTSQKTATTKPSKSTTKTQQTASSGPLMRDRTTNLGAPLGAEYLNGQKVIKIPSPTWRGQVFRGQAADRFRLRQVSANTANVSNYNTWMNENGLKYDYKRYYLSKGKWQGDNVDKTIFSKFPSTCEGRSLSYCHFFDNCTIGYYKNNDNDIDFLIVINKRNQMFKLDFSNFSRAPYTQPGEERFTRQEIGSARLVDNVLYVQHGYNGYASLSRKQNAYISAIDITRNQVLWTTAPLTSNCNFVIVDNTIICGYGFSAEPDYLYLVDLATGQRRTTVNVATGPDLIIRKGNQVHVLTYDHHYVYDIVQ